MRWAPADAIDKRELSIARGAEKTCPGDGSELVPIWKNSGPLGTCFAPNQLLRQINISAHSLSRNPRGARRARRRDLKQSHSTQTNRKAIAIMRRSCSDSLLTASQGDGVFGSHR